MTIFEEIIELLHPDAVLQICDLQHDEARTNFPLTGVTVRNYAEFQEVILSYVKHHYNAVFGYPCDDLIALKWAKDAIGDLQQVAYLGLSGADGGIATLLNKICDYFKKTIRQNYYDLILHEFVDPLDGDAKIQLMEVFREHLQGYAPSYIAYMSAATMAADYRQIIYHYLEGLGRFRNLYRYY